VDSPTSIFDQAFALLVLILIGALAAGSIGGYLRRTREPANGFGTVILGPRIRGWYLETLHPFEERCVRWRIHPSFLSCMQLVTSLLAGYCYANGLLFVGGWLLLLTGTLDVIDGRVARRTNRASMRGAFLDSIIDRYADSFGYFGLAIFFRTSWVLWAILFALLGSLMVSYTRARAEGLGAQCRVGWLQRPERYVILGFGTIFGVLVERITEPRMLHPHHTLIILTLVFLAVAVNLTAIQRVAHVWRTLGEHAGV
jgi:CDP-diacylglycerol--glycerol-3-phosphate 3-phosphatidyltransferase